MFAAAIRGAVLELTKPRDCPLAGSTCAGAMGTSAAMNHWLPWRVGPSMLGVGAPCCASDHSLMMPLTAVGEDSCDATATPSAVIQNALRTGTASGVLPPRSASR